MNLRGTLALAVVGLALVVAELVQRTLVQGAVVLFPRRRHRILAAWQQLMARFVLGSIRLLGGARFGDIPRIPGGSDVLILMNHQSLLDIPLVIRAVRPTYPRIVTRERYAHGKPLISHMVRLYQYPTVNPGATSKSGLEQLGRTAADTAVPIAIYPEGTRTRDGEIRSFKRGGLKAILAERSWQVWIVTVDGYWECARLADFRANVSGIRGRMQAAGPFPSPSPDAGEQSVEDFIDEMHGRMVGDLAALRTATRKEIKGAGQP